MTPGLVPRYLDATPLDPYTGNPLEYQKTSEGYLLRAAGAIKAIDPPPSRRRPDPLLEWRMPR
jgi:hypothetical protein